MKSVRHDMCGRLTQRCTFQLSPVCEYVHMIRGETTSPLITVVRCGARDMVTGAIWYDLTDLIMG